VVTLARDAATHAPDGQPYLRYWNIKLRHEAMLPIPTVLEEQLRRQADWLAERFPHTAYLLASPLPPSDRAGDRHFGISGVQELIRRDVAAAQIRHADGRLARIHPQLFRHMSAPAWSMRGSRCR
jgi:hypothetical protein